MRAPPDPAFPTRLSRRHLAFGLAGILWISQAVAGPAAEEAAFEFVTKQRLGSKLSVFAVATASRTQTYAMLVSKLGADQARALMQREIDALLPRYQPAWNKNLAAVYARHFSVEELQSLATDGRRSKFAGKVAERQSAIGNDLRETSEPVLTALVKEALVSAVAKSRN